MSKVNSGFDKEALKILHDRLSLYQGAKTEVAKRSANGNLGSVYKALHGDRPLKKIVHCAIEVLAEYEGEISKNLELSKKLKDILAENN